MLSTAPNRPQVEEANALAEWYLDILTRDAGARNRLADVLGDEAATIKEVSETLGVTLDCGALQTMAVAFNRTQVADLNNRNGDIPAFGTVIYGYAAHPDTNAIIYGQSS